MARTFGGASTDRIATALSSSSTQRSWAIWAYRTGDGGNNLGRMWEKNTAGTSDDIFTNNAASTCYSFFRRWSGAPTTEWRISRPATNEWHHFVVTYDSGNTANDPVIYMDGVSQTVTEAVSPSGTPNTNADVYILGNRASDNARNWAGRLCEFVVYDTLLTAREALALYMGGPYRLGRAWVEYTPVLGTEVEPEWLGATLSRATVTGTVPADHAPVLSPFQRRPLTRGRRRGVLAA